MKNFWFVAWLFTMFSGPANAQQWLSENGQGVRSAGITYSNAALSIRCVTTARNVQNSIGLTFQNVPTTGSVTFDFIGVGRAVLSFTDGSFKADTAENNQAFTQIVGLLKSAGVVNIYVPNGLSGSFSLNGSSQAIGDCSTVSVAANEQNDTVLKLETSLLQLGFSPGPVDGIADAATSTAIRAYQTARGLSVTGGMDLEDLRVLDRDAQLNTSTVETPPSPAPTPEPALNVPLTTAELRELQQHLLTLGMYKGAINGQWDRQTSMASVQLAASHFNKNWKSVAQREILHKARDLVKNPGVLAAIKQRDERYLEIGNASWEILKFDGGRNSVLTVLANGRPTRASLSLNCEYVVRKSMIKAVLTLASGANIDGLVSLSVDRRPAHTFEVVGGQAIIDTQGESVAFAALARDLTSGRQVVMTASSGAQTVFPLDGAAQAIGPCASPVFNTPLKSDTELQLEASVGTDSKGRFNGVIGKFKMSTLLGLRKWCAPHVAIRADYPRELFVLQNAKTVPLEVTEFAQAIAKDCPAIRSVQVNHNPGTISGTAYYTQTSIQTIGVNDGFVASSSYGRIEQQMPPEVSNRCDQLASFVNDPDKPLGVTGVPDNAFDPNQEALDACNEAVRREPDVRRHLTHLGRVQAFRGDFKSALATLEKARQMGSGTAMVNLGVLQVEGWGTEVDMRTGNAMWRLATFYGSGASSSAAAISSASGAIVRPTAKELEAERVSRNWQAVIAVLGAGAKGATLTLCNKSNNPIRFATIDALPLPAAIVRTQGYRYISPGECGTPYPEVHQSTVIGVAVQKDYGNGHWVDQLYSVTTNGVLPHKFTAICGPKDENFRRNQTDLVSQNDCQPGDVKMTTAFNIRIGSTRYTMNLN